MSLSWRWTVKGHTKILDSDLGRSLTFFCSWMCRIFTEFFNLWERHGSQLLFVRQQYLKDNFLLQVPTFFVPRKTYWKDKEEKELWDKIVKRKTRKEIIKYKYSNLNVYFIESFIAVLSFLFRSDDCFVQQCCESIFDLFDYIIKFS